jgi:hypothetical protein
VQPKTGFVPMWNICVCMPFSLSAPATSLSAVYVQPSLWGLPLMSNTFTGDPSFQYA